MLSQKAKNTIEKLHSDKISMGGIKKIAKEIKKDHELAMELWETQEYYERMLAVLIIDKNILDIKLIEKLANDAKIQDEVQRNYISDWLLANQLTKSKKTITLMGTWQHHELNMLRRLFWYYQARLRWTGKTEHDNTLHLVESIEKDMAKEAPEVQWAMNFCAGQIGVHDVDYRKRCIKTGELAGLYKDEKAPKGCTPNYLPEFIRIEAGKREK